MKRLYQVLLVILLAFGLQAAASVPVFAQAAVSSEDEAIAMKLFLRAEESKSVTLMSTIPKVYPSSKAAVFAEAMLMEWASAGVSNKPDPASTPAPAPTPAPTTTYTPSTTCSGYEANGLCLNNKYSLTTYIQETLQNLGCPIGRPDGVWGVRTTKSVAAANRHMSTRYKQTSNIYDLSDLAASLSSLNYNVCACGTDEALSNSGACVCRSGYERISSGTCRRKTYTPPAGSSACFKLWYQRNAIYDRNGYCFKTTKGKQYFDNSDCYTNSQNLNRSDQAQVNSILSKERNGGCTSSTKSSSSSSGSSSNTCFNLWYQRNAIFNRNGYCFKTTKGKQYFDNSDCYTSSQNLGSSDRSKVNSIIQKERQNGC